MIIPYRFSLNAFHINQQLLFEGEKNEKDQMLPFKKDNYLINYQSIIGLMVRMQVCHTCDLGSSSRNDPCISRKYRHHSQFC